MHSVEAIGAIEAIEAIKAIVLFTMSRPTFAQPSLNLRSFVRLTFGGGVMMGR